MKKLLLLFVVIALGWGNQAIAQKKGKSKKIKSEKHQNRQDRDDDDDDDRYDRNDRNGRDVRYDQQNGKYAKNAPRKVRDALNRDYPNATNISWTKNRSIWTANFRNSGLFGGIRTASYKANGQRVDEQNNGGTILFPKSTKKTKDKPRILFPHQ